MNTETTHTPTVAELAARYQARKAKRIEAKRNRANNAVHKLAVARRVGIERFRW